MSVASTRTSPDAVVKNCRSVRASTSCCFSPSARQVSANRTTEHCRGSLCFSTGVTKECRGDACLSTRQHGGVLGGSASVEPRHGRADAAADRLPGDRTATLGDSPVTGSIRHDGVGYYARTHPALVDHRVGCTARATRRHVPSDDVATSLMSPDDRRQRPQTVSDRDRIRRNLVLAPTRE